MFDPNKNVNLLYIKVYIDKLVKKTLKEVHDFFIHPFMLKKKLTFLFLFFI